MARREPYFLAKRLARCVLAKRLGRGGVHVPMLLVMRLRLPALAAAALLAACGSSSAHPAGGTTAIASGAGGSGSATNASATPPSAPACGPATARTLVGDRQVRVYVSGTLVVGCAHGRAGRIVLGQSQTCLGAHARVGPVAVAGALAAYGAERCGVDTGSSQVVVRRLTDGRVLHQEPAIDVPLGVEAYSSVKAIVVDRAGDVAWITQGGSVVSQRRVGEVQALDRRGVRRLDSGGSIGTVLELRGRTVRWRHGGAWRSATLR